MIKFIKIDKIKTYDLCNLIQLCKKSSHIYIYGGNEFNLILILFKCKCILWISRKI